MRAEMLPLSKLEAFAAMKVPMLSGPLAVVPDVRLAGAVPKVLGLAIVLGVTSTG